MRVTNQMISNQVVYNLNRSLNDFMTLEAMMSTGRRIMKPSDDPVGTQKDLGYRYSLSEISQYKKNISSSLNLLSNYDTTLLDIKDAITSAYEIAVDMAGDDSDTYSNSGEVAANQVQDLFDTILGMANTQMNGRYIFSGFRTDSAAFSSSAHGVSYIGDRGNIRVEIENAARVGINLIGSDVFLAKVSTIGENSDWDVGIDNNTLLSDLNLGEGIDQTPGTFVISDHNTGIDVTVDISAEMTVGDLIDKINADLTADPMNSIYGLTASLGAEGNNISFAGTSSGLITQSTPLLNLNSGSGIDMTNGKILIHNADDTLSVEVDLSSASNIGDVINAINTALDNHSNPQMANVNAFIIGSGTGIGLADANGVPLGLSVDEISGSSTTAADLGIIGDINPLLMGSPLDPVLDFSIREAAAGQSTAEDLGLMGDFGLSFNGGGLEPQIFATTPLSLLNNGLGYDLGEIKISQGDRVAYFDTGDSSFTTVGDLIDALNNLGLDINASINSNHTGIQIESTIDTESLKIEDVGDNRAARTLGLLDSSDIFGSMLILMDSLRNNDFETTGRMIGNFEEGIEQLLSSLASVGAKVNRLETTDTRLTEMDYNFAKLLSEEEDADLTKLVTDLAARENSYQSALIAAAKIIQPSLLNFLD